MKIMMVAGEASGDLHGANLAREILALEPGCRLFGMGGSLMRQAGVELVYDPTSVSVMGFAEALKSVTVLKRVLTRLGEVLDKEKPDLVVHIDFPEFNLRLAEMAHNRGIRTVYYMSPSVWAWRQGRARKIARIISCVCTVFPFEMPVYEQAGATTCYVGHPLVDIVKSSISRPALLQQLNLDPAAPVFALLPGSREQEIRLHLPDMLKAATLIRKEAPDARFIIALAHTISRRLIDEYVAQEPGLSVVITAGRTYDVLAAADAALITSGTATLESALLGTPLVMVYRMSKSTYHILRMLVKIPYVALPNIVLGEEIVPELIQNEVTPGRMAEELLALWRDPQRRAAVCAGLAQSVARLGPPGAVQRAAGVCLAVAKGNDPQEYTVPLEH
ncbi:MAG: lipid-A-disaccharide synthase [Limnochordia bacterium]|jgi:lipid-A-disaccharide synthase